MAKLTIEVNGKEVTLVSEDVKKSLTVIGKTNKNGLKSALEKLIDYQNARQKDGDYNTALLWDELASALVGAYNANQRDVTYTKLLASENPMLSAVMQMTYEVIRVSRTTAKDTRVTLQNVTDSFLTIDLLDFKKFAKEKNKTIGHAPHQWEAQLERLNLLYLIRAGRELGDPKFNADKLDDLKDTYIMSKIARQMQLAESDISKPQLLSNTNLLRELNVVGQAILGPDFKFRSYDVAALYGAYKGSLTVGKSKDGKYAKVSTPSTRTFTTRFLIAMNCVLNGKHYCVESGQIKKR